jgi:UDP-3-O-[3-hydroxymyristoyl] glucosamine N-acyltransferase
MADARFFVNHGPFTAGRLAELTGAKLVQESTDLSLLDVAPLDTAEAAHVSFFDNPKYLDQFKSSRAGACFARTANAIHAPSSMTLLLTDDPYRAYALAAQQFYPTWPRTSPTHVAPSAVIDPTAAISSGVIIAAGAVIGARVTIGADTVIGANTVIGDGVQIGSQCQIGPLTSLSHCLIGDRVILHRGVHIGQDGFGFALDRDGHVKIPQLGRVIVGDDVEIGSGTTIDRGAGPDTIVGAGTKIDNLVQIGHNVQIGKGAVIVALAGISGSVRIEDGVVIGGQAGIAGHVTIGRGAQVAAQSGVIDDIPAGKQYGGSPAIPVRDWHRQSVILAQMVTTKRGSHDS